MKIYLAGPYASRFYLKKKIAPALCAAGHTITSRWIDEPKENDCLAAYIKARRAGACEADLAIESELGRVAFADDTDLQRADMLIRFPPLHGVETGGGRLVETGLAIAYNLDIVLVGPRSNIFDYLPMIRQYPDFETMLRKVFGPAAAETFGSGSD